MIAILSAVILPLLLQTAALTYEARQGSYYIPLSLVGLTIGVGYLVLIQNPRMRRWHFAPLYLLVMFYLSFKWSLVYLARAYGVYMD